MYFNNNMTNQDNNNNNDIFTHYHDILNTQDLLLNDNFHTDYDSQEAILLSDPNFMRQHQLLQEQQKEMQTRLSERGEPVSNLSAMFEKQQEEKSAVKKEKKKNEIDHQRRFNELQARFRVNYTRKPQQQQKIGTSAPQSYKQKQQQQQQETKDEDKLSTSFPSRTIPIQIQRVSRPPSQAFDAELHQRQLDDQLEKVDFDDITVSELKEMLRQRGKPATGKKAILVQRLQDERKGNKHRSLPISSSSSPMSIQLPPTASFSPSSPHLPSSPGASTLHRSIANMHIGSPPLMTRRYSPYSPRSPNVLSSSVPNQNDSTDQLISPINRRFTHQKSYKPFTSSALATPDREEMNPFDRYYEPQQQEIKYEEIMPPLEDFTNMDWLDPSLDLLLQQVTSQHDDILLSNENLENLLSNQQQQGDISQIHHSSSFDPSFFS